MTSGVYKRTDWHKQQIRNQYDPEVVGKRKEALERGDKHYHGTPCKVCGSTEKFVSSYGCRPCANKRGKEKLNADALMSKYRKPSILNAKTYRRRSRILNQMPDDADDKKILKFYEEAQRLTKETGIPHQVDHIKPLAKGGLHHQDNLQVLTAKENRDKSDKYESSDNNRHTPWR